jgi:hypothetical protein
VTSYAGSSTTFFKPKSHVTKAPAPPSYLKACIKFEHPLKRSTLYQLIALYPQVNVTVAIVIDGIEVARDCSLLVVTKDTAAAGSIITNTDALLDSSPSKSPKDIAMIQPPRSALFICLRTGSIQIQASSRDVSDADPLHLAVDGLDIGSTGLLNAFLPIGSFAEGHHTLELSRRSPAPRSIRMALNRTSFTLMYFPPHHYTSLCP